MPAIALPLTADPSYTLSVWCTTGPTVPTPDMLHRTYADWLQRHCADPLRSSLLASIEARPLDIRIVEKREADVPSPTALRQAGATETEEMRLARATHAFEVSARDQGEPRLALWNVLGMSRAIALAHAGVVLDGDVPRLMPISGLTRRLETGVRVSDFMTVLALPQTAGGAHLVLRGLRKLQLPLVQIDDVPADQQPQAALLLQALAQILAYRARRQSAALRPGTVGSLAVPPEMRIDLDHEALRRISWRIDTPPNARRTALVHLSLAAPRGQEATLRVVPPPGHRGDAYAWIAPLLHELLGGQPPEAPSAAGARPAVHPLEAASRRALAALPELKARFLRGLPGGHDVYVKRGFPLPDGGREYMWIHVASWYDDAIRGRLATHPRHRTDLYAGQTLQCAEEDVYDWLLIFPDGREMGGFTDQVPQARKAPRPIPF